MLPQVSNTNAAAQMPNATNNSHLRPTRFVFNPGALGRASIYPAGAPCLLRLRAPTNIAQALPSHN